MGRPGWAHQGDGRLSVGVCEVVTWHIRKCALSWFLCSLTQNPSALGARMGYGCRAPRQSGKDTAHLGELLAAGRAQK